MEHHKYQKVLQADWSFVFWFSFSLEKYTFLQKMSFVFKYNILWVQTLEWELCYF